MWPPMLILGHTPSLGLSTSNQTGRGCGTSGHCLPGNRQRRDFFPYGENIPADTSHGGRNQVENYGAGTYNSTVDVRRQFTGQERDQETGLDYFQARNYSAVLGRFLSVDPQSAGADANRRQSWNATHMFSAVPRL